jgi:transposase-like protein
MVHANAPLTVIGRLRLIQRLESGMTQAQAAEAQGVSRPTVCKWVKRYREEGIDGLQVCCPPCQLVPIDTVDTGPIGAGIVRNLCRTRQSQIVVSSL